MGSTLVAVNKLSFVHAIVFESSELRCQSGLLPSSVYKISRALFRGTSLIVRACVRTSVLDIFANMSWRSCDT